MLLIEEVIMSRKYWELGYSGDWIPMSTDEAFEKKVAILGWSRTENRAFYEDLVLYCM